MRSSEHKKATNFLGWWQKIANHVYSKTKKNSWSSFILTNQFKKRNRFYLMFYL
ncbi:hypothetical protein [Providencia phage PSTNGR2lys]|nr:hypothetical protein [Providencia phage PSTNGR2lys]